MNSTFRTSRGFTLIELLVAVTILSMMILGTGIVITQASNVITMSQSRMSANAEAAAIIQAIRDDIRAMTKDGGFLAIVAPVGVGDVQNDTSTPGALIFTSMGNFTSRCDIDETLDPATGNPLTANMAVVCYTIRQDSSNNDTQNVLCRSANLLVKRPDGGGWTENTGILTDVVGMNPAEIVALLPTRHDIDPGIIGQLANDYSAVATSPQNPEELRLMWPIIAANCVRFSVEWFGDNDGAGDKWHGFRYDDNGDPDDALDPDPEVDRLLELTRANPSWNTKEIGDPLPDATDPPEGYRGTNLAYMALWSHHYNLPDNLPPPKISPKWPKAIKVRFTLRRQVKGENADHDYEVICPISQ